MKFNQQEFLDCDSFEVGMKLKILKSNGSDLDDTSKSSLIDGLAHQILTHLYPPLRSTFAVRETASPGLMGAPRVPPLNPSESIVL